MGCFYVRLMMQECLGVSVPLRGVGCFRQGAASATGYQGFPSPCGAWVVSECYFDAYKKWEFPSPCGVWVVSKEEMDAMGLPCVSVPLRGVGCFRQGAASATGYQGFPSPCGVWVVSTQICDRLNAVKVSVPLRGVGCFMGIVR